MAYPRPDQEIIASAIATNAPYVGRLRSRTLVGSRWLALIGQMATVLIVHYSLKFELPLLLCILAIGANAALNLILSTALPAGRLVRQWEAAAQLTFDVLQLTFLLFLTGGIANPFCLLLIAPVTVSAATLRPRWTLGLIGVTLICVVSLIVTCLPSRCCQCDWYWSVVHGWLCVAGIGRRRALGGCFDRHPGSVGARATLGSFGRTSGSSSS
jgi:two-component system, sensor histidine kinase RegB